MATAPSPDYGRRLIPHVIQDAAEQKPDRVVYSITKTNNPADGFHDITNKRFANAVNRIAWWMEQNYGKPQAELFPAIGYIGPSDLRYPLMQVAAVRVGYKMLYLSNRNALDGSLAVIDQAKCELWVFSQENIKPAQRIMQKLSGQLKAVQVPELMDLLEPEQVPIYPYTKTFEEARQDPCVTLHTSGSTGLPKPADIPAGTIATMDAQHLLAPVEGRSTIAQYFGEKSPRIYHAFPLYHAAGIAYAGFLPFFYESTVVLGPASRPVNLDLFDQILDHGNVNGTMLPPSFLEDIAQEPKSLQRLANTDFTFTGGGPLNQVLGDRIISRCRIFLVMGSTEGWMYPIVEPEDDEWNYFHFHPDAGYTYQRYEHSEDMWEQSQTRNQKLDLFQAHLQTFPGEDEVATKDLYSKHPTKPDRWRYRGRADDVIVLSNGEKLNPVDMEACINDHPAVKASIIVGYGYFQPAVLIELQMPMPANTDAARALKSSLWESIKTANSRAPFSGQIYPDYIIFAQAEKPFVLAGKGTVLRRQTIALYENDIAEFYAQKTSTLLGFSIDGTSYDSIRDGVHQIVNRMIPDAQISATDDLFDAGIDSLMALQILAVIRPLFKSLDIDARTLTARFIYSNNTIEEIAHATNKVLRPNSVVPDLENDLQKMEDYFAKYTANLPSRVSQDVVQVPTKKCVLLTGSTGYFGTYILNNLLQDPLVGKVYCLNRTADARERQIASNTARGLSADFPPDRFEFMHADLFEPQFGLVASDYTMLLSDVTNVIHNQWSLNFNWDIDSFENHIHGVREIANFALESAHKARVFFISSIGAVKNQPSNISMAETICKDHKAAEGGYGCAKLVAEWILEKVSAVSGLNCTICRVGQLSGPINEDLGDWQQSEWVPMLMASSKYLGMVPDTLSSANRIDWLPVNIASKIVIELLGLDEKTISPASAVDICHVVNPYETTWSALLPAITAFFGPSVKVVSWSTWLEALEKSEERKEFERNPSLKLLGFLQSLDAQGRKGVRLPIMETKNTEEKSKILHSVGPITQEWMAQFMEDWGRGILA